MDEQQPLSEQDKFAITAMFGQVLSESTKIDQNIVNATSTLTHKSGAFRNIAASTIKGLMQPVENTQYVQHMPVIPPVAPLPQYQQPVLIPQFSIVTPPSNQLEFIFKQTDADTIFAKLEANEKILKQILSLLEQLNTKKN